MVNRDSNVRQDVTPPIAAVTGVVLAGGKSSRMRQDKSALVLGGQPLLTRVVSRLRVALHEVVVVGPSELFSLAAGAQLIPDEQPGAGPLGGLVSALRMINTPWAFVVASDMPFIQPALVRAIAYRAVATPDAEVVALGASRGVEPLHAAYRRDVLPHFEAALASGDRSLTGALRSLRTLVIPAEALAELDPAGISAFNANTPEEWAEALALAQLEDA